MSGGWSDSTRVLPPNWTAIRRGILERDGWRCTETMRDGTRCRDKATDVDHIARGDDHRPENLRALCRWHHARKSSREGNEARWKPKPKPLHPGLTR